MNIDANTIDEIVKRVMASLPTPVNGSRSQTPTNSDAPKNSVHIIEDRVITEELLKSQIGTSTTIQLPTGAIITPSGRDYILANKITVASAITTNNQSLQTTPGWLALTLTETEALNTALNRSNIQRTKISDKNELIVESISSICRGVANGVLAFTCEPYFVACESNRNQNIRAVVVEQSSHWPDIKNQLSPNVVCVNPLKRTFIETRNLIRQIVG